MRKAISRFFTKKALLRGAMLCALFLANHTAIAQFVPNVQWSQVAAPKRKFSGTTQSQSQSGEDWWYSHKNLYASGVQTGYVMVGYSSLLITNATEYNAAVLMYNEGVNSPNNPINPVEHNYTANPPIGGCGDRDYVGEVRTPVRGNLGVADKWGKMLWCRPKTLGDLQEVIQDPTNPQYVYVVGTHGGAKSFESYSTFIPYNPTSSHPADYFSLSNISAFTTGVPHIYVAKIDISITGGGIVWEGIYGYRDFSVDPDSAFLEVSGGYDIILSSTGDLVVVGSGGHKQALLLTIGKSNGYLLDKNVLQVTGFFNNVGYESFQANGHSLTEIGTSGNYVVGCTYEYKDSVTVDDNDRNRAFLWWVDSALDPLTTTLTNPVIITGTVVPVGNPYVTLRNSNIWEVKYHAGLNEILAPVIRDCENCGSSGGNAGIGYIYRFAPDAGMPSGNNPSLLGNVNAFDLRIGVEETTDGGFVAVSSTRTDSTYHQLPTSGELGYLDSCAGFPLSIDFDRYWDTDALVAKYNSSGIKEWDKAFDVAPNRSRHAPPQDLKLQECLYKISQDQDGGYVISGNCSFNFDDNYMAKLYSNCNYAQTYTTGTNNAINITSNTTWTDSMNVLGHVVVYPNKVLTITGSSARIRFADSKASGILTDIIVMPGGKLVITNGAELTSINNGVCPGSMWNGIVLMGSSSANQTSANQGMIVMSNGAVISNAINGITTGYTNPSNNQFDWSTTGGIIQADGCYFRNNERDVQFMYYHSPDNTLNKSVFTDCEFVTTRELNNGNEPISHISMYEVIGVRIAGCTFKYSAGSAYGLLARGNGIGTYDAQYTVGDCLNPPSCSATQACSFEDMTWGIIAINSNPLRVVNIDHADFTGMQLESICLSSVTGAIITRNEIAMNGLLGNSSGIYLNECKDYLVSNNTITGADNEAYVGVTATNSGDGYHRVYRNAISNLLLGISPLYNNSGMENDEDGLVMNCNNFTDNANSYDIYMDGLDPFSANGDGPTVATVQGLATTGPGGIDPFKLVRNQYAAPCGDNNKWFITVASGGKIVTHADNAEAVTHPDYPTSDCADGLVYTDHTLINFNFSTQCPSAAFKSYLSPCPYPGGCDRDDINNALHDAVSNEQGAWGTYQSLIDNGSTPVLLDSLASLTLSAHNLKNLLIGFSPYLSDTVLGGYFVKGSTTAQDIIDLHDLNAPVNNKLLKLIKNLITPEDFATVLARQYSTPVSARRALDGELAVARNEVQAVYAEKLNYFLHDTLAASRDSVIALLHTNTGRLPNTPQLLVNAYSSAGYTSRAFAVCDSFAARPEHTELMTLQKILLKLDTSASRAFALAAHSGWLDTLNIYAADSAKKGSSLARAVLKQVQGRGLPLQRLFPSGYGARLAAAPVEETGVLKMSDQAPAGLKVYPNPSAGSFNLLYTGPQRDALQYSVRDLLGREVLQGRLYANEVLELGGEELVSGIYFIIISNKKQLLAQQKLIITK